jgi:hypothetical protein
MDAWMHARAMTAVSFVVLATACPGPSVTDTSSGSSDSTDSGPSDDGWFEIGWGVEEFNPLTDGSDLEVVWGTQGAAMFPLPLRGGDFVLPEDPRDYESPLAPKFDLHIDIEGHNDGVGGHFMYLANYPITFEVQPDGSYEFLYVAARLPDAIDPTTLEGLPARLWTRLRPYESEPIEIELDLVVRGGETPR